MTAVEQTDEGEGTGTLADYVAYLLRGTTSPHVLVGPMLWREDDRGVRFEYFMIATGDQRGFRVDQAVCDPESGLRSCLICELARRRPIVIHDMADELTMARMCAAIWPGERTTRLVNEIRAERAMFERSNGTLQ